MAMVPNTQTNNANASLRLANGSSWLDAALLVLALALVAGIAQLGSQMAVSFHPGSDALPGLNLNPALLPYYAARSSLRMFIGLGISLALCLAIGTLAARNAVAERIIMPIIDVLQSVPVLGFLAITVSFFLHLFQGSLLGLEAASIFAIVTGQVWNLIFSYYQSLRTVPGELNEAARLYRFSGWQRFTRLDLPYGTINLVWNGMMSFAGGWFFATQSEAISVNNSEYTLPGLGSYVATAIAKQRMDCILWALLTMVLVVVLSDQLFWRPLVAWSDRFRMDSSGAGVAPRSWFLELLGRSRGLQQLRRSMGQGCRPLAQMLADLTPPARASAGPAASVPRWLDALLLGLASLAVGLAVRVVLLGVGLNETLLVVGYGLLTLGRVLAVVGLSTLVFLPLAVSIGLRPRLSALLQPLILMLASIPANLLFPFFTVAFLATHLPMWLGCVVLMALGSQWYVLFNSTAGASAIPSDLREMGQVFQLRGRQRWDRFLLPAVFSAWVTGAITACGAAWNASIVAEVVTWGNTTLRTAGLGSYIASATAKGDQPRILLGLMVMSLFVVGFNRLLWRPLYRLAERRFSL
jgi:NitT/TauT family transport system permease protein